jgi:SAM-dependent methyltransferase
MINPWLTIPLEDYEGHMSLPEVGQAEMLVNELGKLLAAYAPTSLALVGCAGGNGFKEAAEAGATRIVGIDINADYLEDAWERYADWIGDLELHCLNIEEDVAQCSPVQMVYAALIFEYVNTTKALNNLRDLCLPNGIFAVVLQLPKQGAANVSPSSFHSLKTLSSIMQLIVPEEFRTTAEEEGFCFLAEKVIALESGKQFSLLVFKS